MPEFSEAEQDAMEVLLPAAVNLRHALRAAAKFGISMQVKHPNVQIPSHLDVLPDTPMRVGTESLWVDVEFKPE